MLQQAYGGDCIINEFRGNERKWLEVVEGAVRGFCVRILRVNREKLSRYFRSRPIFVPEIC